MKILGLILFFHLLILESFAGSQAIEKKYELAWPGLVMRGLRVYSSSENSDNRKKPVLIYFHSTDFPVSLNRPKASPFGLYHEKRLIEKLVTEKNFIVIAPDALYNYGSFAWQTNLAPYFFNFETSEDYYLVDYLFKNLQEFHPDIHTRKIFVGGLSSGGYMASRISILPELAKHVRGTFVHSASYASCISYYCDIPMDIPSFHPPTLLIASRFDPLVPEGTIEVYFERLKEAGIATRLVSRPGAWHGMYDSDIQLIIDWLTEL